MLKRARRAKRRDGEDTVQMCGRGGYNGPKGIERKEMEDVRMQRFLEEEGPWCGIGIGMEGWREELIRKEEEW